VENSTVELKDFIARALSDIIGGVQAAQASLGDLGAFINPQLSTSPAALHTQHRLVSTKGQLVQMVEFDVAVTASSTTGNKGGIGVVAGMFAMGGQAQSSQEKQALSRLKFSVPISMPYGDKLP
jgi:hypothetical protein